ncbi:MAG: cation:proton antiporter subunit C [bacterium]|nr:cation:proton antiporter subunit C [bacterium]
MLIETVLSRIDYIVTVILFCIGLYALIIKPNLIKKLIGMNVIETSVYLFFIASADVRLGPASWQWAGPSEIADAAQAARVAAGQVALVNPIPSALILTAIVVSISVTAISLALSIKIYEHYGTLDTRKIMRLKG